MVGGREVLVYGAGRFLVLRQEGNGKDKDSQGVIANPDYISAFDV